LHGKRKKAMDKKYIELLAICGDMLKTCDHLKSKIDNMTYSIGELNETRGTDTEEKGADSKPQLETCKSDDAGDMEKRGTICIGGNPKTCPEKQFPIEDRCCNSECEQIK